MSPSRVRILAVDDDESTLEVLRRKLSRNGNVCDSAQNVVYAELLLQNEEIDLLILDINMPGKSGMEFLPEVVAQYPDLAVLMMTAVIDTTTAVNAMRHGAYDYVTKPVNLDEFTIRIEHSLEKRALVLQNRDYQQNLERMVAERTEQLEQKVRELLALNVLFQEHLRQRFEVVEGYRELLGGIRGVAKQAHNLIERAQSQPLPDLREVSALTLEKVAGN